MSGRSRILIASRLFPPEVSAGAFRLGALARSLHERGDGVVVLTTRPPRHAPQTADAPGVVVRRWPVLRDSGGNVRGYIQYLSYDAPLFFRLLFSSFDVAVAESPPTTGLVVTAVAALRRKPVVYYAADVWTDGVISMGAPAPVIAVMRWMERIVLRRAQAIVSVSDEVTERLVALDADRTRIETVGNGIDTSIFTPDAVLPTGVDPYFVYTGTMSEWQRPDLFIRALALITEEEPAARIRFFGQGAVEADLRALAEEIVPGRVEFGGVVSPQESASWIRGATAALVSIVPGIGYDFARPTKTYAAAAVGTPVLFAGPETGARLVRDADLGTSVDFDPESVATAMRELLAEERSGRAAEQRTARAAWARANVSLTAVAERVAAVTSQVRERRTTKIGPARPARSGPDERPFA
ncbi:MULTISPECIES: glycosyltransferase family 4 protein [unclassified Microbacterium]|uniref:glycosyltransferase family 4 protein n=1 Tax=unclassified Microbacterium TaxID=2609290 RepID=UPI0016051479|nr:MULTISPECIES: glycosyltransferase family 4 protein [unclassified Microbacterium]QNA92271.1 glycosyltransferase family 4 protein [Microbacterium sp. Se63.02b]QYM65541.1 glycosyltransferase family 4 protein [Microbacterium sp. Se5.02b]